MQQYKVSLLELESFAEKFIARHTHATVVGLAGELGAGKTTFVRSVVSVLAGSGNISVPKVISPTFVFHQSFAKLPRAVEHFDLYRLEKAGRASLIEIGYYDALDRARQGNGFVFVEWPSHVEDLSLLELDIHLNWELFPDSRIIRESTR